MSSKLTAILWQSRQALSEANLCGRPLWHWSLEAVQALKPQKIVLVTDAKKPPALEGVRPTSRNRLAAAIGGPEHKVILLPAEIPCIRPRSLKRLLAASRSGTRCLSPSSERDGGSVFCGSASVIKEALSSMARGDGLGAIRAHLQPRPVAAGPQPEELLAVLTLADLAEAARVLRLRKCEELLSKGVLLDDPSTVHIDPKVRVGRGTRIRGWVIIEGESRIAGNCDIGSFSHIVDSEIAAGTTLLDHCFVRSSRIGKGAQLGPFTHIRPESIIGAEAKVGNFVELKKTVLARASKAPHLTYLGDATIGKGVNVGAGTITCNYDGRLKHQTIVEDGAFIGSDVQLVAPIRVGRGAYVAAGSCIVEDVPAESLALARSRQVVKLGWAKDKQKKRRRSKKD